MGNSASLKSPQCRGKFSLKSASETSSTWQWQWLWQMTIDYDSNKDKINWQGPNLKHIYIVIIKFCCSKLPGKKLIHFIQKITTYIEINWSLILMYVMVKIGAIDHCFCFDKSFYVSIQLFLRVHNPVIHNYSLSGQLTVHYYIVFHYICKALPIYNT